MKISIIIPVYNAAPYVEQCIKSVLSQDYEDIEIIIVDDCGTDNSMELVKEMIKETSRTVYILTHQYNRGAAAARNTGIMRATGEYIYFLDSDDYIATDCISSLVKTAQIYPKADMVTGSAKGVPKRKILDDILDRTDLKEYYDNRTEIKKMILDIVHFPFAAWNRLINRDWLLKHGLFFKEGMIYDDLHWIFYVAKYARKIVFLKKTTYYYRSNPNGVLMSMQIEKKTNSIYLMLKDWLKHIDNHCLFAQIQIIIYHGRYFLLLLHDCYVQRHGGGDKPRCVRMLYPLIYLPMFIFNKTKLFR